MTSTTAEDNMMTGSKYHDNARTSLSTAASNAVAPAGGCVVLVICMITIATAVESAPQSHSIVSNFSGPSSSNSFVIETADTALIK